MYMFNIYLDVFVRWIKQWSGNMDRKGRRGVGGGSGYNADDPKGYTTRYVTPSADTGRKTTSRKTGGRLDLRYPPEPPPRPESRPSTGRRYGTAYGTAAKPDAPHPRPKPSAPSPRYAPKPQKKSRYGILYAAIIFTGVVVCISAFTLIFGNLAQNTSASGPSPTPRASAVNAGVPESRREVRDTCLIQAIDPGTRQFTLYSIGTGRTYYAVTAGSTDMKDSFGNNLVFAEFRPGDVVDVVYNENDPVLTSIRLSPNALTFTNQDGLIVDTTDPLLGRITRGNTTYVFGQELISLYKGEPYDISQLSPADVVTMRVYRHVCVFIEITSGTGIIDVRFNDHIRGGNIAIGTNIYSRLDQDAQFNVSEGIHRVIIKGENIEDIMRDVMVRHEETSVIDLSDAQFRRGVIYFSTNIDSPVYLTVNDHAVDMDTPLTLEYGTYAIRGTAMGYLAHEQTFELRDPLVNYTVLMNPLPTPTPRPERVQTLRLSITTNVGGVEVYVDGDYVGMTPEGWNVTTHTLTFDCEVGNRVITLSKTGYATIESAIYLIPGQWSHDISYHMHPEP